MPVARVVCSLTLHVELYDELDGPDARLAADALSLVSAIAAAAAPKADPKKLNPDSDGMSEEGPPGARRRPFFVLRNLTPKAWSFVFNSFRKADEAEFTIPLELLPVPPEAIKSIVAYAAVRHLSADDWEAFQVSPFDLLDAGLSNADFAGICSAESISIQPGEIPTAKLPFKDFLGLLAGLKVKPGVTIDRSLKISDAIRKFLVGTPAENLEVKWNDPTEKEPHVGEHIPKAQKQSKGGKKPTKPTKPTQTCLDAIVEECSRLGCVPRLDVVTLEIANAAATYQGQTDGRRATILVTQIVESIEAEHALLGVKTQAVQCVGYNPDTGDLWTARWPADPKSVKAKIVEKGQPPRLPPLQANIGLPGYEQLDESILLIPVGAVSSKDRLLEMAQMIFLERTRQKVRYTIRTHAPWSNPTDPDADGGSLLRLRAGDTVSFGYVASDENDDGALLPPVVRALTGAFSAESFSAMLESVGVFKDIAARIGGLLASVPRLSLFRVDELHVSGGAGQDPELTLKLANFTQITGDIQRKATGDATPDKVHRLAEFAYLLASSPLADSEAAFAEAQKALDESSIDGPARGDLQDRIDVLHKRAMQGR